MVLALVAGDPRSREWLRRPFPRARSAQDHRAYERLLLLAGGEQLRRWPEVDPEKPIEEPDPPDEAEHEHPADDGGGDGEVVDWSEWGEPEE